MRNVSHGIVTKIIAFILVIICFTGSIIAFIGIVKVDNDFEIIYEENYLQSEAFVWEWQRVLYDLTSLIGKYKNEEYIASGKTISDEDWRREELHLFFEYQDHSSEFNPNLTEEENLSRFREVYRDKLAAEKERLIKNEIMNYHGLLQRLKEIEGLLYYASDGVNVYSNRPNVEKEQFKVSPAYVMYEDYKWDIQPKAFKENEHVYRMTSSIDQVDPAKTVVYVAMTKDFFNLGLKDWEENKEKATASFYRLIGFLVGLILSFIYLVLITGRSSFKDQKLELNAFDKCFTDINLLLCFSLIWIWIVLVATTGIPLHTWILILVTVPIATVGLMLVLSLVRHMKNRTIFKHSMNASLIVGQKQSKR